MPVQVASEIPDVKLSTNPQGDKKDAAGSPQPFEIKKELKGKTAVIVTVPGAFTGTCHNSHLPAYVSHHDDFKSKGVDMILIIATNDSFVMHAWGQSLAVDDKLVMVGDANGEFTKAMGITLDLSSKGMGSFRSQRTALIVKDNKVTYSFVEEDPSKVTGSGAKELLEKF